MSGANDNVLQAVAHPARGKLAFRVSGDSMTDAAGPRSYRDGDFILVDPDRAPSPGDRVVVRLADGSEATFRQLVVKDGRRLLLSLNPAWQPQLDELPGDAVIVGKVVGLWRSEP